MPIDRPREQPDHPDDGQPHDVDRPRARDTPQPASPGRDRDAPELPVKDDHDAGRAEAAASDQPSKDSDTPTRQWHRTEEDPQSRYERALEATAAGDALLDQAVKSLTSWSESSKDSVAAYWRAGRAEGRAEPDEAREDPEAWQEADGDAVTVSSLWDAPETKDHPACPDLETIGLGDDRADHILGRHRHGAGYLGKTEYPADWSDERIKSTVFNVAQAPDEAPVMQSHGRWLLHGWRDGVDVTVVLRPDGRIWASWPEPGGRGVVQNPEEWM